MIQQNKILTKFQALEIARTNEKQIMIYEFKAHPIIINNKGFLAWSINTEVKEVVDEVGINDATRLLLNLGYDKNSEVYRALYRNIGYSLIGYWEIFYCSINNPKCHLYKFKIP